MFIRGLSLSMCLVTLASLVGRSLGGAAGSTIWWIDLRGFPTPIDWLMELAAAAAFAVVAAGPVTGLSGGRLVRRIAAGVLAILAVIALANTCTFFRLAVAGRIDPAVWLPMSLPVAAVLAGLAWHILPRNSRSPSRVTAGVFRRTGWFAAGAMCTGLALPLGQVLFFGTTDYRAAVANRRPAAAVVLGAGVKSDGTPSLALHDRVATACQLYHEGRVTVLLMSGGPGPGATHETEAMRDLALAAGVPPEAIVLDPAGLSTDATARNCGPLLQSLGIERTFAVSHGYHLPRVKLAFSNVGREVYTVPARESRTLAAMPYYVLREVPAMWVYWLGGLASK